MRLVTAGRQASSEYPRRANAGKEKLRLAILMNMLFPSRVSIYRNLSGHFDTLVVLGKHEDNRNWNHDSLSAGIRIHRAWGITVKRPIRDDRGRTVDLRYTHINPGYFWALLRFRPHAVISTEMGFRSLLGMLYGKLFGTPVWIWWGGSLHTERSRSKLKYFMRRFVFVPFVARWISYGDTSTEYLHSLGVTRTNILQIQNCVDQELYLKPTSSFSLSTPRPRALFVGQMIGRKGIDPLLDAASKVARDGYQFSLVLVGDGPEAKRVDKLADQLGIEAVLRIAHVEPDMMPALYRACDFLVFPTLEDVWGLVVNEAILSGLPVLSSKFAGCAEELLPPSSIFDPLNSEEFTDAFRRAVRGELVAPDRGRLKTTQEVSNMIAHDVLERIGDEPI